MDGAQFDRITKAFFDRAHRRGAVRALVGGGLVAAAAQFDAADGEARKKRRRKRRKRRPECRDVLGTCGGKLTCCGDEGPVACREYPSAQCPGLSGTRCCGLEGAECFRDIEIGVHCECCPGLYCNFEGRCQETQT